MLYQQFRRDINELQYISIGMFKRSEEESFVQKLDAEWKKSDLCLPEAPAWTLDFVRSEMDSGEARLRSFYHFTTGTLDKIVDANGVELIVETWISKIVTNLLDLCVNGDTDHDLEESPRDFYLRNMDGINKQIKDLSGPCQAECFLSNFELRTGYNSDTEINIDGASLTGEIIMQLEYDIGLALYQKEERAATTNG